MSKELDKKFLVRPGALEFNLCNYEEEKIEQRYFPLHPGSELARLRRVETKSGERYFFALKIGIDKEREEYEFEITKQSYNEHLPETRGRWVFKERYKIKLDEKHIAKLDIFQFRLWGLRIVKVKFESKEDQDNFVKPDWFGREITNDPRYSNLNLAIIGVPEDYWNAE